MLWQHVGCVLSSSLRLAWQDLSLLTTTQTFPFPFLSLFKDSVFDTLGTSFRKWTHSNNCGQPFFKMEKEETWLSSVPTLEWCDLGRLACIPTIHSMCCEDQPMVINIWFCTQSIKFNSANPSSVLLEGIHYM